MIAQSAAFLSDAAVSPSEGVVNPTSAGVKPACFEFAAAAPAHEKLIRQE